MGSKCNHKYLYKKKAEGNLKKQKRRQKKKEPGRWNDAVTSQDSLQPRSQEQILYWPFRGSAALSSHESHSSRLQNREGIYFCTFNIHNVFVVTCYSSHRKTNALAYKWKTDNLTKAIFRNNYMLALYKSIFYFIDIIWKYERIYQNLSSKFYKSREFKIWTLAQISRAFLKDSAWIISNYFNASQTLCEKPLFSEFKNSVSNQSSCTWPRELLNDPPADT